MRSSMWMNLPVLFGIEQAALGAAVPSCGKQDVELFRPNTAAHQPFLGSSDDSGGCAPYCMGR